MRWSAVALVVAACVLMAARADLPVHCLHGETLGVWTLNMGSDDQDARVTCGYEMPDDNVQHFTSYTYSLQTKSTLEVELTEPNVATVVGTGIKGTWTMVYDEGFEVKINGQVFFAFFAYEPNSVKDLKSTKVEHYTSHCEQTMVGWFHKSDNTHWGCFQAQKKGQQPWSPPQFHAGGKQQLENDAIVQPVGLLEVKSNVEATFTADTKLVEEINQDKESLWEARVPTELLGKSRSELHQMMGQNKFAKAALQRSAAEGVLRGKTRGTGSHWHTPQDAALEKQYNLPASVDWRNKDGFNYAGDVRSQGRCGSCYAFAMAYQAESRLHIKTNRREHVVFSPQQMLSCSITNQGCNGGYPYLLAKHAHEIGMVPESCHPYTLESECSKGCTDSDVYFADSDYGYIGGFYGASEEIGMMEELVKNGPFVVALQVPRELFYYRRGIFRSRTTGESEEHWMKTNHAVTIVGYGTDRVNYAKPVKYWIVKNTWGSRWGSNGFFKIVRGSNNCAIESMPVSFSFNRKQSRHTLGSISPILVQLQAVRAKAAALQQSFRKSLSTQLSDEDKEIALHKAMREQVAMSSQIKALQAKAAEMSHTSNVLIEFGARAASFVQTDQSTAAAAELEVAVREQNLLAARVDSLTQQAEKLYASEQISGTDQVDSALTKALADHARAEARVRSLEAQSKKQHVSPDGVWAA